MKKGFGFPECFLVMVLVLAVAAAAFGIVCTVHKNAQRNRREITDWYEELVMTPEQKAERQRRWIINWLKSMRCPGENCQTGAEFAEKLKAAGSPKALDDVLRERFAKVDVGHECCQVDGCRRHGMSKRRFQFELKEEADGKHTAVVTFEYTCMHGVWTLVESWTW